MSSIGSVTHWINQLKAGDHAAARRLWERYFHRLVVLARKRLQGHPRRAADEEDVALSAFDVFCRSAERGRFPELRDRNNLWPLLVLIPERKALNWLARERRQKRGGGEVLGEAAPPGEAAAASVLEQIAAKDPTPEFAAQVADECRRLLDRLDDGELRSVALWKMEGYTEDEIAARLDCVPRSVQRKLRQIQSLWEKEVEP